MSTRPYAVACTGRRAPTCTLLANAEALLNRFHGLGVPFQAGEDEAQVAVMVAEVVAVARVGRLQGQRRPLVADGLLEEPAGFLRLIAACQNAAEVILEPAQVAGVVGGLRKQFGELLPDRDHFAVGEFQVRALDRPEDLGQDVEVLAEVLEKRGKTDEAAGEQQKAEQLRRRARELSERPRRNSHE